jgi:glucose/arabinose dehydrogenase
MLIASRSGKLRVYNNGTLLSRPALTLEKICTNGERGLLGLAVDPQFETNRYIYLYYTHKKHGVCPLKKPELKTNPVNRVVRYVLSKNDTVGGRTILIDNIPSPNGNHNGGDLHFGNDENLYVSVGDGGCNFIRPSMCQYQNAAARYRKVLLGKIVRITRDGGIPDGNPYADDPDSAPCADDGRNPHGIKCQEIFALGLRNPFRFAVDPDATGTVLRVNDVGGQRWEEIDELDSVADAGAHYGWNLCEGLHHNLELHSGVDCDGAEYTGPIHEYHHRTGCESITGGAFVPDDAGWPADYSDSYLYADFICNKIFRLDPGGTGLERTLFHTVAGGGPVAMEFGPNGSGQDLYYTTFANGGQVRRIAFTP